MIKEVGGPAVSEAFVPVSAEKGKDDSLGGELKKNRRKKKLVNPVVDQVLPVENSTEISNSEDTQGAAWKDVQAEAGEETPFFKFGDEFMQIIEPLEMKFAYKIETFEKDINKKIKKALDNKEEIDEIKFAYNYLKNKSQKLGEKFKEYMISKGEATSFASELVAPAKEEQVVDRKEKTSALEEKKGLSVEDVASQIKNGGKINGNPITLNGKPISEVEESMPPVEKKIGDKIWMEKEKFDEKYQDIIGKSLYSKKIGDFKVLSLDVETSLVNMLVQSKSRKVRINELESMYLSDYEIQEEVEGEKGKKVEPKKEQEKKPEKKEDPYEKIKEDIDFEVDQKKKEMLARIERDQKRLGNLDFYLIHLKNLADRLLEYLKLYKLEEAQERELFGLMEKKTNAANEEIRKQYEILKPPRPARKPVARKVEAETGAVVGNDSESIPAEDKDSVSTQVKTETPGEAEKEKRIHEIETKRLAEKEMKIIGGFAEGFLQRFKTKFPWGRRPKEAIAAILEVETQEAIRETILEDQYAQSVRDLIEIEYEKALNKLAKVSEEEKEKIRIDIIEDIVKEIFEKIKK